MKRTLEELKRHGKLKPLVSTQADSVVFDTLEIMTANRMSAVAVLDENRFVGLFTENDFVKASLHNGVNLFTPVSKLMSSDIYYVELTHTIENCLQIMTQIHVRHLPVFEDGKPVSIMSMSDIMELLVEDKEDQIQHLLNYIAGSPPIADRGAAIRPTPENQMFNLTG